MFKPKFRTSSSVKLGPVRWTTTLSNGSVSVVSSARVGAVTHQTRSTAKKNGLGFASTTKLR